MISAKNARSITDNSVSNRELREIEKRIIEACHEGRDSITKEGRINPEVRRRLIELGYEVFYKEEGFWGSKETRISW